MSNVQHTITVELDGDSVTISSTDEADIPELYQAAMALIEVCGGYHKESEVDPDD